MSITDKSAEADFFCGIFVAIYTFYPKNLHISEKRKYLEYFGRRLISPFPSMFSPFAGTTSPPKLRSRYRANTNILPLKTKII